MVEQGQADQIAAPHRSAAGEPDFNPVTLVQRNADELLTLLKERGESWEHTNAT